MEIKFKKLSEDAIIPVYKHVGDSGMDVCTIEDDYKLDFMEFKVFKTGLAAEIPQGYEIQVRSRSGLACKSGVVVINQPGTVDSCYVGEICVGLINLSRAPIVIEKGSRIAQLVVSKVETAEITMVDIIKETMRGNNGFGSSGIK